MNSSKSEHQRPGQVFARRVKEERQACGWSQQELVDRLGQLGYPMSRSTLIRIEAGGTRAEKAPLQDLLALAAGLGVHATDLMAPLADETAMAITPNLIFSAPLAREWVRGELVLPMVAFVDVEKLSDSELRRLLERQMTRAFSPANRERARADLAPAIDDAMKIIRDPDKYGPGKPWPEEEGENDGSDR